MPYLQAEHSRTGKPIPKKTVLAFQDQEIPVIREKLLIETVRSAFGESRGGLRRKPSDEAWDWILSENREMPFSFAQCCREWEVDPDKMLDWLRYYRRKFMS